MSMLKTTYINRFFSAGILGFSLAKTGKLLAISYQLAAISLQLPVKDNQLAYNGVR